MRSIFFIPTIVLCSLAAGTTCNPSREQKQEMLSPGTRRADWGTVDGKPVYLYTLVNRNGNRVKISNYGGIVTYWECPDRSGRKASVVIGFDSLAPYLREPPYFGAIVGRYANRIGKARFNLDGTAYTLAANNGRNHLHGGIRGFDRVIWEADYEDSIPRLRLRYTSPHMEEGYPGKLDITVTYTLTDDDALDIVYEAVTDAPTIVNLTNHSYFNLSGGEDSTILDHALQVQSDAYTPVDAELIPTGELRPVQGSPFDFRQSRRIGSGIGSVEGGYDHNFVLSRTGDHLEKIAVLSDSASGRMLEVYTTEPGIQFYSGNFLDGRFHFANGKAIPKHGALCLETQHFPDSPNQPGFPSTVLRPGETYRSVTSYRLLVSKGF
jgi:aldose 1-epimerase